MSLIPSILRAGHAALRAASKEKESTKKGTLRGGNSGAVVRGEGVVGKCHRITLARFLGHQAAAEGSRDLMFDAGFKNEDSWYEVLKAAWKGVILREEEVPVVWETSRGIKVTGRPDFVLCEPGEVTPEQPDPPPRKVLGLELKLVASLWTMFDVIVKRTPKTDHVIQAAHYKWKLGIPYELWYTSRVDWPITGWLVKSFVRLIWGDHIFGEDVFDYNERGEPKKIYPFYAGFELDIRNEVVYYRAVGSETWVETLITTQAIEDYYELIGTMAAEKTLGERPAGVNMDGSKMGYDKCSAKYCPFSEICDRHEDNYDDWVAAVEEATK